jgi:ATP adenylyltransferase
MDRLWSPWRYQYISSSEPEKGCIFCDRPSAEEDEKNLILYRGEKNFVLLNLYPYTSGHLMIAPYAHVATLEDSDTATVSEMMLLAQSSEKHLRSVYRAPGFNIGMNVGLAAGAGVAGHIHMHVLPRWPGDVNFMTSVGETRVLPEDLPTTYTRLLKAFRGR